MRLGSCLLTTLLAGNFSLSISSFSALKPLTPAFSRSVFFITGGGNLRMSFTTKAISSYLDNIKPSVSGDVPSPGILCTGDSL